MNNKTKFTANERKAIVILMRDAMIESCADTPIEVTDNRMDYLNASTLIAAGWSRESAAGTFSTLYSKKVIVPDGDKAYDYIVDAFFHDTTFAAVNDWPEFAPPTGEIK